MASTAHKTEDEIKEFQDPPDVLVEKVAKMHDLHRQTDDVGVDLQAKTFAQWIQESDNFSAFTGAGISTSAGIPDYRGPDGVWTLRAQGRKSTKAKTTTLKAIPTATHMSMVQLVKNNLLKFVISQNTDGLHRKSGIPPEKIAELHGNTNLEICTKCGAQYMRDFHVRTAGNPVHAHETGRICASSGCHGKLKDSIINFGENLPDRDINLGFKWGEKSDLMVVLGSSLRVTPAADMPARVAERKKRLVIVNLQKTPYDSHAALRVFAKTDEFMAAVIKELGLEIPPWLLYRRVVVSSEASTMKKTGDACWRVGVRATDVDGKPMSLFKEVHITIKDGGGTTIKTREMNKEPFAAKFPTQTSDVTASVTMHFMGHYMEPPFTLDLTVQQDPPLPKEQVIMLAYDVRVRQWTNETASAGEGEAADALSKLAIDG